MWKKIINPQAVLYIVLIVAVTILIGYLSSADNKKINIMTETKQNIILETNLGNIEISLLPSQAPKTVANFIKLAKDGFYENTKFHRVIKGFMIQGGDPYTKGEDTSVYGTGGPGYKFADEINPKSIGVSDTEIEELELAGYTFDDSLQSLPLVRGTLAMANSGPNTNGSQFFIVTTANASWLNGKHTGFGIVVSGMEIVDKINNVPTTGQPYDRPLTPIIIQKVIIK